MKPDSDDTKALAADLVDDIMMQPAIRDSVILVGDMSGTFTEQAI